MNPDVLTQLQQTENVAIRLSRALDASEDRIHKLEQLVHDLWTECDDNVASSLSPGGQKLLKECVNAVMAREEGW